MSFKLVTSEQRYETLINHQKILEKDFSEHIALGGRITDQEFDKVRATIFAQVYGILSQGNTTDMSRRALRWLMAHMGASSVTYNHQTRAPAWERIMKYYFQKSHGHYTEMAALERILLSMLRSTQADMPISDLFIADRQGDHYMMTDWIMHQDMTHGRIQTGIQVTAGSAMSKMYDLAERETLHDRALLGELNNMPGSVRDFMRHTTAVMSFPMFTTVERNRARALRFLLSGSKRYQSEMIATTGNRSFNKIGRQVKETLQFVHENIVNRVISGNARFRYDDLSKVNSHNERVSAEIKPHGNVPILRVRFQLSPHLRLTKKSELWRKQYDRHTSLTYAVRLDEEYLDAYRHAAGVRARSD